MQRTFADLNDLEKQNILEKLKGKRINELKDSLEKLDEQFWQSLKEGNISKAQKVADISNYIQKHIKKYFPV